MKGMYTVVNPSVQDAQMCAPSSRRAVKRSHTSTLYLFADIAAAVSVFFYLIFASALCGLILLGAILGLIILRITTPAVFRKKQPVA